MQAYVDTSLHVYALEENPQFAEASQALLFGADWDIAISQLVVMECLVMPLRDDDLQLLAAFRRWFAVCTTLPLTDNVFLLAAELRARTPGLKTPDAIHLACAIHHGCDEFWTNDDRSISAAAAGRIAIRTLG